jgi:hypothetical protein
LEIGIAVSAGDGLLEEQLASDIGRSDYLRNCGTFDAEVETSVVVC